MPLRKEFDQAGDVPWGWLKEDAPTYFPPQPSLDITNVRLHYLEDEPVWQVMKDKYGPQAVWNILSLGSREILVDGWYQERLQNSISRRVYRFIGDRNREYEVQGFSRMPIGFDRALPYSDIYMRDIEDEMSAHPMIGPAKMRAHLAISGALLNGYFGVAVPEKVRKILGEEATYLRYNVSLNPLYRETIGSILEHYKLPPETKMLLTGKGKQAISLLYETLLENSDSGSRTVVIGDMYKEAQEQIPDGEGALYCRNVGECNLEKLFEENAHKRLLFLIDPMDNSPEAGKHNVKDFLTKVSGLAKKTNTPAIVVSDITLEAGEFDVKDISECLNKDGQTVFITIESLLKYFSLGHDLTYMGALTILGSEKMTADLWSRLLERYNKYALSPSIVDMGSFPPVESDYLHHRASRISRNELVLAEILGQELPDIKLRRFSKDAGFKGGMFWMDLKSKIRAERAIQRIDETLEYGCFGSVMARAGFGYNETCVSLVDGRYLRVSVGTQDLFLTMCQAEYMAGILVNLEAI
jgi:hypothetical protein